MAKPNYRIAKQRREQAKKVRQLQKRERQASRAATAVNEPGVSVPSEAQPAKPDEP